MTRSVALKLIFRRRVLLLLAGAIAAAIPALGQTAASSSGPPLPAPAAASQLPSFEVASVKPNHSGTRSGSYTWSGDRATAINMPLKILIELAYHVKGFQISGGPAWIESDSYDIDAKIPDEVQHLPSEQRQKQIRLMLQSLFADRFKLTLRQETKMLPVYDLVAAKNGPRLQPAASDPSKYPIKGADGRGMAGAWREGNGQLTAQAITTATLAQILSDQIKRNVVDRTNLPGTYDITLQWSEEDAAGPLSDATAAGQRGAAVQSGATAASIFTAVQEQLGLKLEPAKAPVETLVIEHIERPSEN